jgi:hypothetical protein
MEHLSVLDPTAESTLEEVRERFEIWRRGKKRGSQITKSLWAAAVEVCTEYSVNEVSRALGLNYSELKRRAACTERTTAPQGGSGKNFVELSIGLGAHPVQCSVELESAAGGKLKMTYAGKCREFDLVELAKVFWGGGR